MSQKRERYFLVLLSALLFSMPWFGITSLTLFFAFVPLLVLQQRTNGERFVRYAALSILLWNIFTTYWVAKASFLGVVAGVGTTTFIFTIVIWLYNLIWKISPRSLSYTFLVTGWVAMEYVYLNGEISWPWLILGNGFAIDIKFVQWYEYSGTLGGSLWVLIVNLLVFEAYKRYMLGKRKSVFILPSIAIVIPAVVSLIMYYTYKEESHPCKATIIQPNIDPYHEKFDSMSQDQQEDIIVSLLEEAPKDVNFIVAPETALDNNFWVKTIDLNSSIVRLRNIMTNNYPNSALITGLTTITEYPDENGGEYPTPTARLSSDRSFFYDVHNSAVMIDSRKPISIYHKSKLVIGVEMLPYAEYIRFIDLFGVDLGGVSGMLAPDKEQVVFTNIDGGVKSSAAICYESVYGEFFSKFVEKGAQVMFVITNDGWWGNTFGYHQHFSYSRLRAVECRRSIIRSANTGISGFINQRGDVIQSLGWDIRGTITDSVNLNDKQTFFVKYGDVAGRLSCYVSVLSILYFIAYRRRKKDYLYNN